MSTKYQWQFYSLGGVPRVKISTGEDIAHLGELDQKLWTALSCPTADLQMDPITLGFLDTDADGKIRVAEVVAAAQWLTSVIKNNDSILEGASVLPLEQINTENPEGAALYASAKQILANLGQEKQEITIAEASDSVAIFKGSRFNGDGIVTAVSSDDQEIKDLIAVIAQKIGSATDRSGEAGVGAEQIEAFYAALGEYAAWKEAEEANKEAIFPYGDNTAAALAAVEAVKEKFADFFMRCKIVAFNSNANAAVDVPLDKIAQLSAGSLAGSCDELGALPIAQPNPEGKLPLDAVNPAWHSAVAAIQKLVLSVDAPDAKYITESQWSKICSRFDAYTAHLAAKKGAAVEALGLDAVKAAIAADRKADLLSLVEEDKALEKESAQIDAVKKLMYLYRDFYKFLCNYVVFSDFYQRGVKDRAIFEIGQLYIDQRCCDLCIKVTDMGKHADMAKLSGMFLIYCKCTSKTKAQTMDIVAVMTDGDISDLRAGKNGVFYDRDGNDWDAVVTKVVDNPVSIKQAFWSPYRKFWEFCVGIINKSAADKDAKMMKDMQAKASAVAANPPAATPAPDAAAAKPQAFDIAKFAGIFAAIGMAIGYIGQALTTLITGIAATPWWGLLLAIAGIMLVISGPSCFIAWSKLRQRNLGPVLNANGWAINSRVLVNILFGGKLTTVAKYPKLRMPDPYIKKTPTWKKVLVWSIVVIAIVAVAGYFIAKHCFDYTINIF
ncbi:MAG: hypothetical protein IIU68_05250 [Bacteroidales bacterium]|nr:hypothetical protein [Bacteroidales bacterium]